MNVPSDSSPHGDDFEQFFAGIKSVATFYALVQRVSGRIVKEENEVFTRRVASTAFKHLLQEMASDAGALEVDCFTWGKKISLLWQEENAFEYDAITLARTIRN